VLESKSILKILESIYWIISHIFLFIRHRAFYRRFASSSLRNRRVPLAGEKLNRDFDNHHHSNPHDRVVPASPGITRDVSWFYTFYTFFRNRGKRVYHPRMTLRNGANFAHGGEFRSIFAIRPVEKSLRLFRARVLQREQNETPLEFARYR